MHWTRNLRAARKPGPRTMNETERAYSEHLETLKHGGEILDWQYEALTLKLASDCRYTPDFFVVRSDMVLECHEVKGFWADDAKVKLRVAAEKFPFRFVAVKKRAKRDGGGFTVEEF